MYTKILRLFIQNNLNKFFIIIFCITLCLTGFILSYNVTSNIKILIGEDSKPLFGADIKITTKTALNNNQLTYIQNLERQSQIILSEKIKTETTLKDNNNETSLISLTFIDDNYPLYGTLEIENKSLGVYISKNLEDNFNIGGFIEIYGINYRIGGIIKNMPDDGIQLFEEGRDIILQKEQFKRLELERLGARIQREYLLKVRKHEDFNFILKNIKEHPLFENMKIDDYSTGGSRFLDIFSSLDKFIQYIIIVSFLLTSLTIFLSIESFYISNKKQFSILRILGLKNRHFILLNFIFFSIILIASGILSALLSEAIFHFIRNFEISQNFHIDPLSLALSFAIGCIIIGISVIFPLIKFILSSPLAGMKENFLQIYSKKEILLQGTVTIFGIILLYNLIIGGFIESLIFSGITLLSITLIIIVIRYILMYTFKNLCCLKKTQFSIYDSIRNTIKPGNLSLLISFGFILSFSCLMFLSLSSFNFLETLNIDLKNNKNLYILNLTSTDIEKIDTDLQGAAYGTLLGRILTINGVTMKEHLGKSGGSGRFTREFNITNHPLKHVAIREGNAIQNGEVSIDYNFSQSLNIGIGDEIEFLIYGLNKKLRVANIRESITRSIEPFFYFQVDSAEFKKFPKKYFLSTYIPTSELKQFKIDFLNLTGSHVSFIEVDTILQTVRSVSEKVILIIQILFIYIFIFCIISLVISIIFLIPFKEKKSKLYSILGADKRFIYINNISEYLYLQIICIIFSIIFATALSFYILSQSTFIGFSLQSFLFSLSLVGVTGICITGVISWLLKGIQR